MNRLLVIVTLFWAVTIHAQWTWQNPLPQGNTLTDIKVFKDGSALAIGYSGTVLKTSDNGNTWVKKDLGYSNDFNSMCFVNDSIGWLVGSSGLILKTMNSGETWKKQEWNDTVNTNLLSVYFINADTGWAGSDANFNVNQYGVLLNTIDGGKTWTSKKLYGSINQIKFVNNNFGWISAPLWQSYYITKDGGNTWNRHARQLDEVYFIDSLNGFLSNTNAIYKTIDGGNSWNKVITFNGDINRINFLNNKVGWAVGYQNYGKQKLLIGTSDGGNSWSVIPNLSNGNLYSIDFNNSNTGYAVGYAGVIVATTDGGNNWREISSKNISTFRSIYFTDPDNGWAVGGNISDMIGFIYNTTDGGRNWNLQLSDSSRYLNTVYFANNLIGWAGGFNRIIKTTDGGKTWNQQYYSGINSIYFIDKNNGWAVSDNHIINTTDGGSNWYLVNPSVYNTYTYYTVLFRNKDVGFIGGNGFILKSTDGGNSWDSTSGPVNDICSIAFSDSLDGTAISNGGAIFQTKDGGNSWNILQPANYENYFSSVKYRDSKNGLIVGKYGFMLFTSDGGNSWTQCESPTNTAINSIFFIDSTTGWAAGNDGAILKYNSNDSVSSVNNKNINNLPNSFYLSQNYPNPFNPSTKIEYRLNSLGIVTIKIFNVLGQEVKTLINKYESAGSYSIQVDLSNYPSGVYFYKLKTKNYQLVKKMILLK